MGGVCEENISMNSGWNHRIIVNKDPNGDLYYGIHEVHYEDFKPTSCTEKAVELVSEEPDFNWTLDKMKECHSKPILIGWKGEDFLKEYVPLP